MPFLQRHETCHFDRSISQGDISKTGAILPTKKPETESCTKRQLGLLGFRSSYKKKWNCNDTVEYIDVSKKLKLDHENKKKTD